MEKHKKLVRVVCLVLAALMVMTIGVLRLHGAKTPLRVEQKRRPFEIDGAAVKVVADLGACLLSRTGIVRGGVVASAE